MSQEEFKAMVEDLVVEEEKRHGIGSKDFLERHQEIMTLIEEAEKAQAERRKRLERQFIGAKEVAEILGVSESKSYSIIRELNKELKERGFITVQGKNSRAFFSERLYKVEA